MRGTSAQTRRPDQAALIFALGALLGALPVLVTLHLTAGMRPVAWAIVAAVAVLGVSGALVVFRLRRFSQVLEAHVAEKTAALRQQMAFLDTLLNTIPYPVYFKGLDGRYVECNAAFERKHGLQRAEVLGKTVADIQPAEEAAVFADTDRDLLAKGGSCELQARMKFADGLLHDVLITKACYRDGDGRIGGIVGIVVDITELIALEAVLRDAKEKAEAADRAKSDFLAVMSHEIRTPLSGIIGVTSALMAEGGGGHQLDKLRAIDTSARTLLSIIGDVLDFARLERGTFRLAPRPFLLGDVVESVIPQARAEAEAKGLRFSCAVDRALPERLVGDPARLQQVLLNLLGNALKFTEAGAIDVAFSPAELRQDAVLLKVVIRDTGIGIDAAAAEEVFKPFVQADSSIARRFGGSGLGLAVSRRLVELQGGALGFDSTPGEGSTFWFTLPLAVAPAVVPPSPLDSAQALAGMEVLVVEDNAINVKVMRYYLDHLGCRADYVEDGAEAVAALEGRDYELVLMDMHMPGMDGLTATRVIRRREQERGKAPVRILGVTANAFPEDRQRCLDAGMDDYLAKPFTVDDLEQVITRLFEGSAPAANPARKAPQLPRRPVLDETRLRALLDGVGPQGFEAICRQYLAEAGSIRAALRRADAAGDVQLVYKLAHDFKSSSTLVGLMSLAQAAAEIEMAAREGRLPLDKPLLEALSSRLRRGVARLSQAMPQVSR